MAIYHFETKVISRGTGRSAVTAAAYMSCSEILNDYEGAQHNYTRKQGLVWQQVFLPENAPTEWADRAVLWNTVEEEEHGGRTLAGATGAKEPINNGIMLFTNRLQES